MTTVLNKSKPCVLVDIDGTIANTKHRERFVISPVPKERKWKEFFDEMDKDTVIIPTAEMVARYCRPDNKQKETKEWLKQNNVPYHILIMKNKQEYRLKGALFKAKVAGKLQDEGYNIKLAIDDEEEVRQMYALIGIKNIAPVLT
jgi:hypothetical protein